MDNNSNIIVIAHFNGSVIKNTEESVIFMSDESLIIFVPQTISFEELNVVLYQGINTGTLKRVVRELNIDVKSQISTTKYSLN